MLQNPCKTLGFKKNMVYKIPPGGGGKPYPASGLYAQSDQSLCYSIEYSTTVKLLTKQYWRFLSLKGGCTGSSECIHVKLAITFL